MNIIIRKNVGAAHILLVQVEHGDVRIVFKDHAGDYLVPKLQILSGAVLLHILSHLHDLAGSLMAQSHGNQPEGISLKFMGVSAADSAALHPYQHIVVSHFRHGKFLYVKMLQTCEHGHMRRLGDGSPCASPGSCTRLPGHAGKHLPHDLFYLCRISHFTLLSGRNPLLPRFLSSLLCICISLKASLIFI